MGLRPPSTTIFMLNSMNYYIRFHCVETGQDIDKPKPHPIDLTFGTGVRNDFSWGRTNPYSSAGPIQLILIWTMARYVLQATINMALPKFDQRSMTMRLELLLSTAGLACALLALGYALLALSNVLAIPSQWAFETLGKPHKMLQVGRLPALGCTQSFGVS